MTSLSEKRKTHLALDELRDVERPKVPAPEPQTQRQNTHLGVRHAPSIDTKEHSKGRRTDSTERKDFDSRITTLDLQLPRAVRASVRAHEYVMTKYESPWKTFQKVYDLKLKDFTTVAARIFPPCELVTVKLFEKPADGGLDMLQQIRHENFVTFLESYQFEECSYSIFEHVAISLVQIVTSPPYPTELQLAAIIGQVRCDIQGFTGYLLKQVLNGLAYLDSKGYLHGSLACANILLSAAGVIKIGKFLIEP